MANTILSGLFSTGAARIVSATTGFPAAANLKVVSADIELSAMVFKHKMEDGQTRSDGRALLPTTLEISAFIPDFMTLVEVNKILMSRDAYYNVVIKDTIWMTVVCSSAPQEQSAEVISATPVSLSFKEIIKAITVDKPVEQGADGPTRQRGDVQPQNTTMTQEQVNQQVLARQ